MMNSGSGNLDQVAVGVVDESDIDFESWINELKSDDCLEFVVMSSEDMKTSNSDYSSQPITSTINGGTSLISGSANQSQGGMSQEMSTMSSLTPSNSTATLQTSGPVLYAAPSLVSNYLAQNCQSMRTTDYSQYHSVQPTQANQNLPLRQQQVHSQAHQYNNTQLHSQAHQYNNTQLQSQAHQYNNTQLHSQTHQYNNTLLHSQAHQYNNTQLHSQAHQSNIIFGQKNNHPNHQMIWDQHNTYTRPMVDSQMGNVRNQQVLRQLQNVNWNPNNNHLQVQQNTWTAHDLITGGVKHGNNLHTNLTASVGFATPEKFPSSSAWREYAFRQIRQIKESYLNDLIKMHNNASYLCSKATNLQASNEYQKVMTYLAKMIGFLSISNIDFIPKHDESVYNSMTLIVNYVLYFRSKNSGTCHKHAQFNWSPVPSQQVSGLESNMVIRKRKAYSRKPVAHYGRMPCLDIDISSRRGPQPKSENPLQIYGSLKAPSSSVLSTTQQINLEKLKQPMRKTNERRKCIVPHGMSPLGSGLLDQCPSPQLSLPSTVNHISRKTASPQWSPLSIPSTVNHVLTPDSIACSSSILGNSSTVNHVLTPESIARSSFILGNSSTPSPHDKQSSSSISASFNVESQEHKTPVDHPGTGKGQEPKSLEDVHHHLVEVVDSVSSKSMVSSLDDIHSVVKAMDSIPDYELDNLLDPYDVNELNFMQEINNDSTHTMKCDHDQIFSFDWDILHTQTSTNKRRKIENNYGTIVDEIKEINSKLVETSLDVVSDTFIDTHSITGVSSGTIVKCSYKNVCPAEINGTPAGVVYSDKRPEFFIQLLVPAEYPASSPRLFKSGFDVLSEPLKKPYEEMLSKFDLSLHELPKKNSLGDMARKWDSCVRGVLLEFLHKSIGKGLTSRYGNWENSSSGSN